MQRQFPRKGHSHLPDTVATPAPLLTTAQIAERLQLSQEQVQRLCKSGELRAVNLSLGKVRATYRVSEDELMAFLSLRTTSAPVQPQKPSRRRPVFEFIK